MLCGTDNIMWNVPHIYGCGEYYVEHCQSHRTSLWIRIILWWIGLWRRTNSSILCTPLFELGPCCIMSFPNWPRSRCNVVETNFKNCTNENHGFQLYDAKIPFSIPRCKPALNARWLAKPNQIHIYLPHNLCNWHEYVIHYQRKYYSAHIVVIWCPPPPSSFKLN